MFFPGGINKASAFCISLQVNCPGAVSRPLAAVA